MNKTIIGCVLGLTAATAIGSAAHADKPTCNWGQLTQYAILDLDFEQGAHSSDPSGDGHGPGTNDEARAGLGNVVEQGDLDATCALIESLLPPQP